MTFPDDAAGACALGWRNITRLHSRLEDVLEHELQSAHRLSVSEYTVLDVLSQQDVRHMRMQQLADAVVLSQSATTRLVSRLEKRRLLVRFLCEEDRRGIYTEVTTEGHRLLRAAKPTHDAALVAELGRARTVPELAPLVDAACRFA